MDKQRAQASGWHKHRKAILATGSAILLIVVTVTLLVIGRKDVEILRSSIVIGKVERGEMLLTVRGLGNLVPRHARWQTSETDVRVERILVFPGTEVSADTVIMELHNARVQDNYQAAETQYQAALLDHRAKRTQLRVQVLQARADLSKVESELEAARAQEKIERFALDKGVIPQIQYDKTRIDLDQLKARFGIERDRSTETDADMVAQLRSDELRIAQLKNTRDLRKRELDALHVRAGIDGVLQRLLIEEGQQVPEGTKLALVSKPSDLEAELRVPETQARDIEPGQLAVIDTRNGKMTGKVSRIDPEVVDGTVKVRVSFEGKPAPGARPDLSVDGVITVGRLDDALFVRRPINAQRDSQVTLFRVQGDEAKRVPVGIGSESSNFVEIKDGLRLGDQVILSDMSAYDDHDRIRLD